MTSIRESKIELYLKAQVEKRGGLCLKLRWIGRRNAPDRILILPGKHLLVELKRPRKEATEAQAREHNRLRAGGFEVYVINSFEDVDRILG